MTWTIHLGYRKIPDGLSLNSRGAWQVKNRSTKEIRTLVALRARQMRIPRMERIGVTLTWVVNTRHTRDPDNLAGLFKVAVDGLASNKGISAHLVADDDPGHVHREHPAIEYQPEATPHFELTITDLSHPFRPDEVDLISRERLT